MNKVLRTITIEDTDLGTGEVLGKNKQQKFLSKRFDPGKGYLWRSSGGGVKTFFDVPYPENMSMIDRGRMATLAKCIWHDTNMLGYRGHGRIKPYGIEGIGKIIGLDAKKASAFIRRMIRLGVIKDIPVPFGEEIEIQYYVNPVYYFAGPRLSGNLYVLFHRELDELLPEWVKQEFAKADNQNKTKQFD